MRNGWYSRVMGVQPRGGRGFSLMETVIAIFVITFAVMIMAALFRSALDGAKRTRKIAIANVLADKRLQAIVHWAGQGNNFSDWSSVDGASGPDSQFPDFNVRSDAEAQVVYSPCSESETRYPASDRRALYVSAKKVRVRVTWSPTSDPRNKVDLLSLVGAPPQPLDKMAMKGTVNPLSPLSSLTLNADGRDNANDSISDLFYFWTLSPLTGYGQITPSRDGRKLVLKHRNYDPTTGGYRPAPGEVSLSVKGTSMGVTKQASVVIVLNP